MHNDVRHVCIHGHFYQPPRENPWLEETEREESAAPFHDWNERIAEECYKPNAAARILDADGRIGDLKNNYEHLSFNFGPTLLRWMERHSPTAYQSILDADRVSANGTRGHGNAIAQVYNHVILPLANARDKNTQIRWGIRDFEHRFGRKPEGMWLAETAVDASTLAALADNGITFTILSPFQAKRWRLLDGSAWKDTSHGEIPTGRAYVYQGHKGRPIHLFFYDGSIAKGIAFDRMLSDASHVVGAVDHAHRNRAALPGEPWLVHTATDGESYGHHFAHGDMALAAAFARLEGDPNTRITNYASFLAQNPVRAEADILDVSAWSCAHGVGRWSRDCGCAIGGAAGWTQRWREPLREALNILRDALATHYEREMAKLARDPWAVRDAYIDVVLQPARSLEFARKHMHDGGGTVDFASAHGHAAMVRFFSLLEMQRAALLMFTSCGWFFDDVSGGESIILMKYAARALELAAHTGADKSSETAFLEMLARAESNIPSASGGKVTGRDLFHERARSVAVTTDKVVVSHALRTLSEGAKRSSKLYAYRVTHHEEVPLKKGAVPCLVGHVTVEDTRTHESADTVYALAHFGGLDFRCSVKPYAGAQDTSDLVDKIRAAAVHGSTTAMMRALDEAFGPRAYTLKDAFYDLRQNAARAIGAEKVTVLSVVGAELLENHRALLLALRELGVPLPPHVEALASSVLSQNANELVIDLVEASEHDDDPTGSADIDFAWRATASRLKAIAEEATALGLKLDVTAGGNALGDAIVHALRDFGTSRDDDRAAAVIRLVDASVQLGISPRLWDVQTESHRLVQRSHDDVALRDALRKKRDLLEALDRFGRSTFARRLQ